MCQKLGGPAGSCGSSSPSRLGLASRPKRGSPASLLHLPPPHQPRPPPRASTRRTAAANNRSPLSCPALTT
eukprot:96118-Chlamydomonas_euryale.AAC.1